MSNSAKIYIKGEGVISPLGADGPALTAAVAANANAMGPVAYYDSNFQALTMATVPAELIEQGLDERLLPGPISAKQARLLAMANLAVKQLPAIEPGIPLFLSISEATAHGETLDHRFIDLLARQSGLPIDTRASKICFTGRAGAIDTLKLAFAALQMGAANEVIVGGVDTFHDLKTINALLEQDRLSIEGSMNGFLAGEGACFFLLTSEVCGGKPCILHPGSAMEPGHLYSDEPCLGNGLSNAVAQALSVYSGANKISRIYSSMNGEAYFAKELGVMMIRHGKAFSDEAAIEHPADCYGDTGAASGFFLLSQLYHALMAAPEPGSGLVYCSSDYGYRGAVVMCQ